MKRWMWFVVGSVLLWGTARAEYLVKLHGVPPQEVHRLAQTGNVDVEGYRNGTLTAIVYDLEALQHEGYRFEVVADLDSLRTQVWNRYRDYHSYTSLMNDLSALVQAHPDIARLDTIGYSVQGRALVFLKISDNVNQREFEPEVRIVGTHHGNEWPSTEIPYMFAQYLLDNYGTNPQVTQLVNEREIWIMPLFNPDGHEMQQRRNANNVDLNRDYGYMWGGEGSSSYPYSQPETQAMYEFSQQHNFTLSLSYHTYGEVVNYIWNWAPDPPPDSTQIVEISEHYASYNGYWVTEGYQWYQTLGDLNDYSYGIDSDIDWTIELANEFVPPYSQIPGIFEENRQAMLDFVERAGQGIGGFVFDAETGDTIKEARIYVEEIGWPVFTDPVLGDYVRVLQPGTYTVRVEANGYEPATVTGVQVQQGQLTRLDVSLTPGGGSYAYKLVQVEYVHATHYIPTHYALGAPDNQPYSLGNGKHIVLDMGAGHPIVGSFTVYEADVGDGPEGYTVKVANHWQGPWTTVGTGTGTQTFSLPAGMSSARYVRIEDDGNGGTGTYAGFDLDAIESTPPQGPHVVVSGYHFDTPNGQGTANPGDTALLFVSFRNVGTEEVTNAVGLLQALNAYAVVLDSVVAIGNIPAGGEVPEAGPWRVAVADSVPPGYDADFALLFQADNLQDTFDLTLPVITPLDYLVWDPDPNHSSGPVIHQILTDLGYHGEYTTNFADYSNRLADLRSLFVCLGIYSDNYRISAGSAEGDSIVSYLMNHNGRVYMEGGDVWYYDPTAGGYDFNTYFGINALDDGSGDLGTLAGQAGTFTAGMSFSYTGENNWIDHIEPGAAGAMLIWQNSSPSYGCGVAYVSNALRGEYRTVGVSFELGGLQDGTTTRAQYLDSLAHFFGLNTAVAEDEGAQHAEVALRLLQAPGLWTSEQPLVLWVPRTGQIESVVYDATGRRVAVLLSGRVHAGRLTLRAPHLPHSGIYFLQVQGTVGRLNHKFVWLQP